MLENKNNNEVKAEVLEKVVGGAGGSITCWNCKSDITPSKCSKRGKDGKLISYCVCPCCDATMTADGKQVNV